MHSGKRCALVLLVATLWAAPLYATEWKVIHARDRDYVTFANLAEFYRFGEYSHANRTISLRSEQRGIRAQVGTSEIYINGVRFFTHFPLLERAEGQLVSAFDVGKMIEPVLRPSRIQENAEPVETVVLDPGHGGTDQGTANKWGSEKNYALEVALTAREKLLRAGFKVEMTRTNDTARSLEERIAFANKFQNAVFISIHFNSGSGTGVESYALAPDGAPSNAGSSGEHHSSDQGAAKNEGNAQDSQNIALTAAVHAAALSELSAYDRGIRHARFKVLRHIRLPSVLIEGGFLDDREEGLRIASAQYRQKLGAAIAQGVQSYNAAVNYRPGALPAPTFAVVRANLPPHTHSITEPLEDRAAALPPHSARTLRFHQCWQITNPARTLPEIRDRSAFSIPASAGSRW